MASENMSDYGIKGDLDKGSDYLTFGGTSKVSDKLGIDVQDPLDLFGFGAASKVDRAKMEQAAAAMRALEFQKQQYEELKQAGLPYVEGGARSFGLQGALTGMQGEDARQKAYNQFEQYIQPAIDYGKNVSMFGMPTGSGYLQNALGKYVTGVAGQDYDRYYNALGYGAGLGQGAASSLGGVSADAARGIAATQNQMAENITSANLAKQQMRAQGISNLASIGGALASAYGAKQKTNYGGVGGEGGGIDNTSAYKWNWEY